MMANATDFKIYKWMQATKRLEAAERNVLVMAWVSE